MAHQMHRRKSSKDDTDLPPESPTTDITPRTRTLSNPQHGRTPSFSNGQPPSAGPFRATFHRPPGLTPSSSPLRPSFSAPIHPPLNDGHSRSRSISNSFAPSPLASSFPANSVVPPSPSQSSPSIGLPTAADNPRRHARLHSRNLSVFFPRPGSLPHSTIAEDGSQEVEVSTDSDAPLVPSASPLVSLPNSRRTGKAPLTPLGQGFTFGARPPPSAGLPSAEFTPAPKSASATRRGHHHKHSLSHNFFSFLEPGGGGGISLNEDELHTQPTPTPMSPWGPMSAIPPDSAASPGFQLPAAPKNGHAPPRERLPPSPLPVISRPGLATSVGQFVLGAWLWVTGQQVGSLSVTGLGYWVVFDALGVALAWVVPGWLVSGQSQRRRNLRRPYGNGRVETVLMFAQAVYLMFSSVYVCKETVEHLLLTAGGAEGHHHHPGDEDESVLGIDFPIFMSFITFFSLLGTAYYFENGSKIVHITGNRIPPLPTLIRNLRTFFSPSARPKISTDLAPTSVAGRILSNPYAASPLGFAAAILGIALFVPLSQHRLADLFLSSLLAFLTFRLSYKACLVLGTTLLQTSPPRGLASGKMEAFLRAMREIERHPLVLHLPAPHVWQLTPSALGVDAGRMYSGNGTIGKANGHANGHASSKSISAPKSKHAAEPLIITLELHVRNDLDDDEVLELTRWAWERCAAAVLVGSGGSVGDLRMLKEFGGADADGGDWAGGGGGVEVTVGVVRG